MSAAAYIDAVGLLAPGLSSWQASLPILNGTTPCVLSPLGPVQPTVLPPNERRRSPLTVRMALNVCSEATAAASVPAAELASVFSSSDGDMDIVHRICLALTDPTRGVSPTDFHNSVHNAAAGYWSIAAGAQRASTAISAYDYGLIAGLREALALLAVDNVDVLLVMYDAPPPPPLFATRPISHPGAVALVLTRQPGKDHLGRISLCDAETENTMSDAALETLRQSNPALRALPLLQALARRESGIVGVKADASTLAGIELRAP